MSHTGVWPQKRAPRSRSLACLFLDSPLEISGRIVDEYGNVWQFDSWPQLAKTALEGRYDVFTPPWLIDTPAFGEIIADNRCRVLASKSGGVTGVLLRVGKEWRTFMDSKVWGWVPCAEFLHRLREFFDYVGAGEYASPAALGEAIWRQSRTTGVSTPCAACCADLREHSLGGRADTPALGARLLEAYEIDMRSAYLSFLRALPTGTACRMHREPWGRQRGNIWFGPCEVDTRDMETYFSPVGYRTDAGLSFPVRRAGPRQFTCWLWSEEVRAARDSGARVRLLASGWQWTMVDHENETYLQALWDLREGARDAQEREWLKSAGVAALGRQALPPWGYVIIDDASPKRTNDDLPLVSSDHEHPISGLWLHAEPDDHHTPRVTHWWAYTLMKCRLALWSRMEWEHQAGNVVLMTNYDAILLREPSRGPVLANPTYGEWKQQKLTRVRIPYPRAIYAREKQVLPGVSGEDRERYAY